jgi:tetratricopeptide (TPR) repeat protein
MDQQPRSLCPVCGGGLTPGGSCERCAQRSVFRLVRREVALLTFLSVLAVAVYLGTRALANSNLTLKEKIAVTWFNEGERDLRQGHADDAVAAFRKAAVYNHRNRVYLLSLARALEAAHRDNEGRELLLQLRESVPENPEINVELARISARERNVPDALRYYHNALYGIWTGEDVDKQRQDIRRELIDFLVSQNAKEQALAETVALAAHLPSTPAAHLELGTLFLRVEDSPNALQEYARVLRRDPRNQIALRGAGEAAFKMSNYAQAKRHLNALAEPDAKAKEMLETAKLVLESDPFEPRLSEQERIRRARADIDAVKQRMEQCLAQRVSGSAVPPFQEVLDKLTAQMQILAGAQKHRDPNAVFSSLEVIYDAENLVSTLCGPLTVQDNALLLMAQKDRGVEQ